MLSFFVYYYIDLQISKQALEALDLTALNIAPTINFLNTNTDVTYYENAKFKWIRSSKTHTDPKQKISVMQCSTISNDLVFDLPLQKENLKDDVLLKEEKTDCNDTITENIVHEGTVSDAIQKTENGLLDLIENNFVSDVDDFVNDAEQSFIENDDNEVDGSNLDEEYAKMVPISVNEAKAVVDVYKMFATGKFQCTVCGKSYHNENRLRVHMRMHDKVGIRLIFY